MPLGNKILDLLRWSKISDGYMKKIKYEAYGIASTLVSFPNKDQVFVDFIS
jgi:hypothetical protein